MHLNSNIKPVEQFEKFSVNEKTRTASIIIKSRIAYLKLKHLSHVIDKIRPST